MSGLPPAQWAPDPYGRFEYRYWDGASWTYHVLDAGLTGLDPSPVIRRSTPLGFLTLRAHLLVSLLTCGLWALALPALHAWRSRHRARALAYVVAIAAGYVTAVSVGSPPTPAPQPGIVAAPYIASSALEDSSGSGDPATTAHPTTRAAKSPASPSATAASGGLVDYSGCPELNAEHPHGVGLPHAVDETDGTPARGVERDAALYRLNADLDVDGDGIACER